MNKEKQIISATAIFTLKIGEQTIQLSQDEAYELYNKLANLLKVTIQQTYPLYPAYPHPYPAYPHPQINPVTYYTDGPTGIGNVNSTTATTGTKNTGATNTKAVIINTTGV